MSIEKEVERMYREDAEKMKKNEKKKKNSSLATIIILILILIVALLMAKMLGLFGGGSGFGFGNGKDNEDGNETVPDRTVVVNDEDEETSEAEAAKVFENIKVSGSTYLYKGSEVSLDELKDTFSMEKMNKDVVALIEDDNATQNTMEDLTKALDEIGRSYTIENNTDTSDISAEKAAD